MNARTVIITTLALSLLAACAVSLSGCGAADPYEVPVAPFRVVGSVGLPSDNDGVAYLDGHAYVAGGEAGLHVISLADPTAPELLATVNTNKYAESVQTARILDGGRTWDVAIVVEATEGLSTYDVTDPMAPVSFEQGGGAYDAQKIHVEPGADPDDPYMVLMADSWRGLRLFTSVPGTPGAHTQIGNAVYSRGYTKDVDVVGGWAYVADDELGIAVFDVSNPDFPELVTAADAEGNALGIEIVDGHAYLACGTEGLTVFAIDGGETPVKVSELDLTAYSRGLVVRNGWCLLAAADGGVHVVDVSDPADPVYTGSVHTGYATDVAITDDGRVIVSDREDGLVVLGGPDMSLDTTPPARVTTLTATPLDFTRVRLDWLAPGDDSLLGRAVSYEIRSAAAPIADAAAWDAATPVAGAPTPADPGTAESFVVDGFTAGETVHFALRAVDDEGLAAPVSDSAAAELFDGLVLNAPGVDTYQAVGSHVFRFEVTYLNAEDRAPAVHDVEIDGTPYAMSLVEGTPLTGALYRHETTLALAGHTFRFVFDDGQGLSAATELDDGIFVTPLITFEMGSPADEPGRDDDELLHTVGLRDSVVAATHEVTQSEWEAMGMLNESRFAGADRPVENVTWFQAVQYCNALSDDAGLTPCYQVDGLNVTWDRDADGWRLPTEAEWEWLARGGNAMPLSNMDAGDEVTDGDYAPYLDPVGWYEDNAPAGTADVAQKTANPRGLYDVHGNVWEWCWDWYGEYEAGSVNDPTGPDSGDRRVIRGGSWHYRADDCRSASRGAYYPTSADDFVGLRPVRTVVEEAR